jgi:ubiquinone/menaquinone biosynthesis C-methylase UbiE
MRWYWDGRAQENAVWYVDTSLDASAPDMDAFFATGHEVVATALDEGGVSPDRFEVAVEIGAGLGRICAALAPRFDRVIGVDIAPQMIEQARALVSDPKVTFVLGDGATLPGIDDGTVDLVVSFTVFQHIPERSVIEAYLREAARVLRPGGVLAFQWNSTPGHRRWIVRRSALWALHKARVRRTALHAPQFLGSRVEVARIRTVLEEAGVDVVTTRGDGLWTWAWAKKR